MGNQQSGQSREAILANVNLADLAPLPDNQIADLTTKFGFTPAEVIYAHYCHARIQALLAANADWISTRVAQLLFRGNSVTLEQYLKMIEWWHSSPFTTKLQYVFSFVDVDGDEFITIEDLLIVIPRLLGSRPQIGDKVHIKSTGFAGTVRYVGLVPEKGKGDFVGIELSSSVGSSNGTLKGQSYFKCLPMHGVFIHPDQCELHSTYDWINAISTSFLGRPALKFSKAGFTSNPDAVLRISWVQFSQATINDPQVLQRLVKWFFPLPLRMGEAVPASFAAASNGAAGASAIEGDSKLRGVFRPDNLGGL